MWPATMLERPFWNPYLETMSREQIEQLWLQKLKLLLRYVTEKSPLYREKYKKAGLKIDLIRSLDDFKRNVPLMDKPEILASQAERPPYGLTLSQPVNDVHSLFATSGTTGRALNLPFTIYDTERYGESWVYGWWGAGIRPGDSMYFAFNWGRFAGFWSAYWGARRLGLTVYSGGGQSTDGHLDQMLQLKPTILVATPTYGLRLGHRAVERGIDTRDIGLKFTSHAGEPGPNSIPAMRHELDTLWHAVSTELYGVAEVDSIGPGCPLREGVHLNDVNVFSWRMDPATGKEVGEGEVGELIVSTFVNTAQPLVNYRTHDLVRAFYSCACGRTWTYLKGVVLGRSDHMITIRGTNVYPTAVENLVIEVYGSARPFQMVISRDSDGLDQMTVRVESAPGGDDGALREKLAAMIRSRIGVRLEVEMVEPGSLPRSELKGQYVIDSRPKELRRELER